MISATHAIDYRIASEGRLDMGKDVVKESDEADK